MSETREEELSRVVAQYDRKIVELEQRVYRLHNRLGLLRGAVHTLEHEWQRRPWWKFLLPRVAAVKLTRIIARDDQEPTWL